MTSPPYTTGKISSSNKLDSEEPAPTPPRTPTHFVACVAREASAKEVRTFFEPLTQNYTVIKDGNLEGARTADIVLLACKPQMASAILGEEGMSQALNGKLLISVLGGVSVARIREVLGDDCDCRVVRAMPNTASAIAESATVLATPEPSLPPAQHALVVWMLTRIGRVETLPERLMDVSTALCGSGPAFYALMLEAMADGAVRMGMPRREANLMAAQTMKGAACLVLAGEHPALLRDKVSTPGGCTIGGLLAREEGRVRGTVAGAVREATIVASQLGAYNPSARGSKS